MKLSHYNNWEALRVGALEECSQYHFQNIFKLSLILNGTPLLALITEFSISLMVLDRYFLSQIIKRESHFRENLIVCTKSYTTVIALCSKAHCLDY